MRKESKEAEEFLHIKSKIIVLRVEKASGDNNKRNDNWFLSPICVKKKVVHQMVMSRISSRSIELLQE